jgi:hypothetical protein
VWVGIMFQGDFLIKITLRSHRSRLWCGGNLDANDLWVGIMFQGDFFTKITLRSHRSRLWCEGNLCYGPYGATVIVKGLNRGLGIYPTTKKHSVP